MKAVEEQPRQQINLLFLREGRAPHLTGRTTFPAPTYGVLHTSPVMISWITRLFFWVACREMPWTGSTPFISCAVVPLSMAPGSFDAPLPH